MPFAQKLESVFKILDERRRLKEINDAEFLSFGLLTLLACRQNNAFQKNPVVKQSNSLPTNRFLMSDFLPLLQNQDLPMIPFKKWLDTKLSLVEFLQHNRFRGIPDSARQALLEWLEQKYPLTLLFYIPTVADVFNLQKNGGRCVTLFLKATEITQLYHERDVISFVVHDLIHAHEFYENPKNMIQQIGFYHWLDNISTNPLLQNLIQESNAFRERWEYILSDMNSYCGHLLKTLHAAFVLHASDSSTLWRIIVQESNLIPDEATLFLKINTLDWADENFLQLEKIFENIQNTKKLASST